MNSRWNQIRTFAADLRASYAALLGHEPPFPLDVVDLAEQVCLLSAFPDPTLDPRINGELNAVTQSIRLRPGMNEARQRFIIAHELGHFVLEGAGVIARDDDTTIDERIGGAPETEDGVLRVYNTRERHEQEANLFALELILPADAIWHVYLDPRVRVGEIAAAFGVSSDAARQQICNVFCFQPLAAAAPSTQTAPAMHQDPEQHSAVTAPLPTLVVAGPGTGKTRSIVAKYVTLVEQGVDPAAILALTFSNKAAEEMRSRIIAALQHCAPDRAGRVDISTFHAWGLNFLKEYGTTVGLPLDVRLRARGDLFVLLKRRLAELPLSHYKTIKAPGQNLGDIASAISRAKDELCPPAAYRELAAAEAERLVASAAAETAGKTTKKADDKRAKAQKDAQRLHELAVIYAQYETLLRDDGALDYGDLIMQACLALQQPEVARVMHAKYQHILVDEFQDINYASGQLIALLDGGRGCVWAVGDPWQSIYRFRGASPANLAEFPATYPGATQVTLLRNYRSRQSILDASQAVMDNAAEAAERPPQQAQRRASRPSAVEEWVAPNQPAEYAAIAHDILRRVGGRRVQHAHCTPLDRPLTRTRPAVARLRAQRLRWRDHAVLCRSRKQVRAVVEALEAHRIPVDGGGELLDYPEVQDALAVCALARSIDDAGLLRTLTLPEYRLSRDDLDLLVRNAHAEKRGLSRATRDDTIVVDLSPEGQRALEQLYILHDDLSAEKDAWRVLTRYLLDYSSTMRERMSQAAQGNPAAQRELANLGQLVLLARTFVRQAPPAERGAAAFIAYLRLLLEAGETPMAAPLPAGADAVRVMTIHKAKGLEFPTVYVPGLQKDIFPPRKQGSIIPELPAMVHGESEQREQEERYLLYVAMTRARDRLVLSRAECKAGKAVERSLLLPPTVTWPSRRVRVRQACPHANGETRLRHTPVQTDVLAGTSLDTYKKCPRRYFYQYGYQLFDDDTPHLRMHQAIHTCADELAEQAQQGALPEDETALQAQMRQIVRRKQLDDVLYGDDYQAEMTRQIEPIWQQLQQDPQASSGINQRLIVPCAGTTINVRIDRIERTAAGIRYIQIKSGQPKDDDQRSTRIMLYILAAQHYEPNATIAIHYTATGETRPITTRQSTIASHLENIEQMVTEIVAGNWEPSYDEHCNQCPFNLICPV